MADTPLEFSGGIQALINLQQSDNTNLYIDAKSSKEFNKIRNS
jgi:hypothetical protein